jgi:methylated-DNA-protein-cysteine methyltransferase related protein
MVSGVWERIYDVIRGIPAGRVSTYGIVAEMAGMKGCAKMVGFALHSIPSGSDIPWHRVINSQGRISRHPDPVFGAMQRSLLEVEGIRFDDSGRVADAAWFWPGPPAGFRRRGA